MKVIIAGGREVTDYELVKKAVELSGYEITEVVSGGAPGADRLGEKWGHENGVFVTVFEADWDKYGKAAGPMRNSNMARYADALIAIDTGGPGTRDMISQARVKGLRVFVVRGSEFMELQ